jgi:hypothetical protein
MVSNSIVGSKQCVIFSTSAALVGLLQLCPVFDTFDDKIDIIWSVQAVSCSSSCNEPFKQSLIHCIQP